MQDDARVQMKTIHKQYPLKDWAMCDVHCNEVIKKNTEQKNYKKEKSN